MFSCLENPIRGNPERVEVSAPASFNPFVVGGLCSKKIDPADDIQSPDKSANPHFYIGFVSLSRRCNSFSLMNGE